MVILTTNHIDALKKAIKEMGGQQNIFAKKVGLQGSYISRYLNVTTKKISSKTWDILRPHIEPYLEPDIDECLANSKSCLTIPLMNIFERLTRENAVKVLFLAEDLLKEQENAGGQNGTHDSN
ncbi:hypothetical protein SDC9_191438 [bioreactor metagenome]|uniref:HTH cro/C1-type domain-containing protein n=1 Tax=bioreactor metagenome TaxID=1076179 RepID=A0A645HXZ7_9ZZZZ